VTHYAEADQCGAEEHQTGRLRHGDFGNIGPKLDGNDRSKGGAWREEGSPKLLVSTGFVRAGDVFKRRASQLDER